MNSTRLTMTTPFICRLFALVSALSLFSSCTLSRQTGQASGDLQQIGLIWLKHAGSQEDQQKVIDAIHDFEHGIPEVKSARVGRTDGIGGPYSDTSYDLCFILSFKDEAARQRYNVNPLHQKAAKEVFLPLSKKLLFYRFVNE